MPRDLAGAAASAQPVPIDAVRGVHATRYRWRDPSTIPERQWLYGRQMLRGSLSVVVAPGGTGKTALMTGIALCLVTGREMLGKRVWGGPAKCWLWNLEDGGDELARGIQAAAMHWSIGEEDLGGRLFVDSGLDGAGLCIAYGERDGFKINAPVVDALTEELKRRKIDALIVDPFVSSHTVSENDNGAIDAVAKLWARVAAETDCSIVLVHHSRKLAGAEVTAESARGAISLIAAARSVVVLNRMSEADASRYGFSDSERRRFFSAMDDKNNRAPQGKGDWFELQSVLLGNGTNGGDSLPVVVPWMPPDPFEGVGACDLHEVQTRISANRYWQSDQAGGWAGEVVADVLGLDVTKPADKGRIKSMLATWTDNGALRVEKYADKGKGRERPCYVVGVWADVE